MSFSHISCSHMRLMSNSYKTAERVSERLTDMGKDLTTMIEEINEVSSTISKTSKSDDPVSPLS